MVPSNIKQLALRRRERKRSGERVNGLLDNSTVSSQEPTSASDQGLELNKNVKGTTRRNLVIISSLSYFICLIFMILTIIGNINNKAVIRNTWIFNINLSNIIPVSMPSDVTFVNSLARSLGLHDFYQAGLWGFCEGYSNEGITSCSKPRSLYWFNPVEILLNELLAGATITLPAQISTILTLLRVTSHIMFAFFLTGACMTFISIFLAPVSLTSRRRALLFAAWAFVTALLIAVASIIATAMAVIFRAVARSQPDLNVDAEIGVQMFAFMWTATGFSIIGWIIHLSMGCCCGARKRAKRKENGNLTSGEKQQPASPRNFLDFRRKKTATEV